MKKYLSNNLHFLRINKGLQQSEMQEVLDIKSTTWSMYENDKSTPYVDVLIKICKYFEVSESDILHVDLKHNVNLIGKNKDEKKQENVNPIVNASVNPIVKNRSNYVKESEEENELKSVLNDPQTTFKQLPNNIYELSVKQANFQQQINNKVAAMEQKIDKLIKVVSKINRK